MKLIRAVIRSSLSLQNRSSPCLTRPFSAQPESGSDYRQSLNSSDSADDFEKQEFSFSAVYKNLNRTNNKNFQPETGSPFDNMGSDFGGMDGPDRVSDTLGDGMDYKLKRAATYFEFDPEEVSNEFYAFRPDINLSTGMTYDTKDLDLQKLGVHKPRKTPVFETTTAEVLREADFRNVKFLANFLTEAGIIIKRSQTGISAKAQRKVAREIKTARSFGLLPFTTMGTKAFVPGMSMEDNEMDFSYEETNEYNFVDDNGDDAIAE